MEHERLGPADYELVDAGDGVGPGGAEGRESTVRPCLVLRRHTFLHKSVDRLGVPQ